uniref:thiamine pyrophosphate-dependent enzyme n=1 Tax=Sciscionella sediminilitoris TaxID=1445613 RepID=UPI0004DF9427
DQAWAAAAAAQAWSDSVPVLFLSPGMPLAHPWLGNGELHEVKEQRAALDAIVAYSHRVGSVAEIGTAVAAAFARMTAGRSRPVHLEIPLDLLEATAPCTVPAPLPVSAPRADESTVDAAARALGAARRPVLIAGGGARAASGQLRELAERLTAPVLSTANGKGVLDERHPLAVGAGLHQPSARTLAESSDVVLAVGTELAPTDLWNGPFEHTGTLIRVDIDAAAILANADPDIRLVGEAAPTLSAIRAALPEPAADRSGRAAEARSAFRADAAREGEPWAGLTAALREVVDQDTILAGDSTRACYYGILSGVPARRPAGFLYPAGMGTLGYGLPAAIGAKLAEPDAKVLAVLGDGGIMFTIAELATAAQLRLGIPVLVVDDNGYGEIRAEMLDRGEPPTAVTFGGTDFLAVARGFGCHAEPVTEPARLPGAITKAFGRQAPTVLHLRLGD